MKTKLSNGQTLKNMFVAGTKLLEDNVQNINAINVFPVPDGDTGTNMLLTMYSALEETKQTKDNSVSSIVQSLAHGALMGARGNSGVILSQFWRGIANSLDSKETFTGRDFAEALGEASKAAYEGVIHPVEGTMLTVLKDAATAAAALPEGSNNLLSVMETTVAAAHDSVLRTPELLPMLQEAGVVDAGGQGLYILLSGALDLLNGKHHKTTENKSEFVMTVNPTGSRIASASEIELPWGYCINFLLEGERLNLDRIKRGLNRIGQSLVVVGDNNTARIHIHSFNPGKILSYATHLGTLHQVELNNMDDQYAEFMKLQREHIPQVAIATIAIASGEGFFKIFDSLGTTMIVPGGQTMNPSVRQILRAVEEVPSDNVIILPNNKNIILTASQVESLTQKKVRVIPSTNIPQGIAALLSFNIEMDLEKNVLAMEQSLSAPQTIEITKAARKTQINGNTIKKGQFIAVVNDHEIITNNSNRMLNVILEALVTTNVESSEIITIYYGAESKTTEAEGIAQNIRNSYNAEVEVVNGGQPHYNYIISLE
jgi:DAK2 domain fusion protein YloV